MSASNRLEWKGLDELRRALRDLPRNLKDDATPIIHDAAERARSKIDRDYPEQSGDLRRGLAVVDNTASGGTYGAVSVVVNKAKHAHIYEHGTETVRLTNQGWSRGRMPAGNKFVPNVIRERHTMYDELKAMLEAHGLEVSGDA